MVKNINVRLDSVKDSDIIEMLEHSTISNPQLFKLCARLVLSHANNLPVQAVFNDEFISDTKDSKKINSDTNENVDDTKGIKKTNDDTENNKKINNDTNDDTENNKKINNDTDDNSLDNEQDEETSNLFKGIAK